MYLRGVSLVLVLAACRINFDPVADTCPADTAEIEPGAPVCIEKTERGTKIWVDAKAACVAVNRRLCADLEWLTACEQATGLIDMANDGGGSDPEWEWMAEMEADVAKKRGYSSCADASEHGIYVDAYDFRCCVDLDE